MKPALQWTPQARADLIEIYVALQPSTAERLYTAIEEKANLLTNHPRLGVRRPEIAPTARMLVGGVYLIPYETHPDTDDSPITEVEIVRVVHGHRDLARIF